MKFLKIGLVIFVLIVNLLVAPPSWADRPKLTNSADYTEVNQAIERLLDVKDSPDQYGYTPEQIQHKLGALRLQKYILETAEGWGRCRNETGKTLAVYAHKPKKSFFPSADESTLYYLGDGEITDDEWNCNGVYLPSGVKVAGLSISNPEGQEVGEPIALKLVGGTQLVVKTNPDTGAFEFNVAPTKVFTAGEGDWSIPTLSQADIDAESPNAPIDD